MKDIKNLNNYKEIKGILESMGYEEVTLTTLSRAEHQLKDESLNGESVFENLKTIKNAIDELTGRDKKAKEYEEKAEASRQKRVNYEKEFCDRIYTEDATDDDITRTVERITGMKRITCNKIVGFLNKSNKLTANEKQILKMYVMLCNDTDALVSNGYLDFCNGKDLEEIATEIEEKAEKIVDNIKQEEIKSRKNSMLLGVIGATVTITATIVGAPVAVAAIGTIATITGLAKLAKSVKRFGFKIR